MVAAGLGRGTVGTHLDMNFGGSGVVVDGWCNCALAAADLCNSWYHESKFDSEPFEQELVVVAGDIGSCLACSLVGHCIERRIARPREMFDFVQIDRMNWIYFLGWTNKINRFKRKL